MWTAEKLSAPCSRVTGMSSTPSASVTATEIGALAARLTGLGTVACAGSQRIDQLRALEELKAAVAAAQVRVTAAFDRVRAAKQRRGARGAGAGGVRGVRGVAGPPRCGAVSAVGGGAGRPRQPVVPAIRAPSRSASLPRLVEDLPATLAALEAGVISEWRASIIVRESSSLTPADRRVLGCRGHRRPGPAGLAGGTRSSPAGSAPSPTAWTPRPPSSGPRGRRRIGGSACDPLPDAMCQLVRAAAGRRWGRGDHLPASKPPLPPARARRPA